MRQIFNFSAGPSMLPLPVLERVQKELISYNNTGCSVMEMSHRSAMYEPIIQQAEVSLRKLMHITDDYAVLFVHGGATLQFTTIPMNLASRTDNIDYVTTGEFATKAFVEGQRWSVNAKEIASSKDTNFTYIPTITEDMVRRDAKYLHITVNNTIYGTMYEQIPKVGIPLVGDMSSIILGKEYDVNQFGIIYAGAQKNMGPAGVCIVIAKRNLLGKLDTVVPPILSFKKLDENQSMINTPSTLSIYIMGLVFEWVESMGGVKALQKINEEKATLLYNAIDNSSLFSAPAVKKDRSIMNIPFILKDDTKTDTFLKMATKRGLINLKGHRSVGGCRASIYNAMPIEGVKKLIECIQDFEIGKTI